MTTPQSFRGERLGLPEDGPGAIASPGTRIVAFAVDALASALIAGLFVAVFRHGHGDTASRLPQEWSLIPLALDYLLGMLLAGQTLGMRLFNLRIIRVDDQREAVNPWRALVRTVLLFLLVPAVIFDKDGRGLHDRYSDTAVVQAG